MLRSYGVPEFQSSGDTLFRTDRFQATALPRCPYIIQRCKSEAMERAAASPSGIPFYPPLSDAALFFPVQQFTPKNLSWLKGLIHQPFPT
ncbi:hypothetical protein PUR_09430 [Paenibacillus sp. URB8-2]|nr:hypothetical protein PUR_09430 [Paenibacillus sp. URB8-2]